MKLISIPFTTTLARVPQCSVSQKKSKRRENKQTNKMFRRFGSRAPGQTSVFYMNQRYSFRHLARANSPLVTGFISPTRLAVSTPALLASTAIFASDGAMQLAETIAAARNAMLAELAELDTLLPVFQDWRVHVPGMAFGGLRFGWWPLVHAAREPFTHVLGFL